MPDVDAMTAITLAMTAVRELALMAGTPVSQQFQNDS
jgi:hypothetical protein